MTVMDLSGYIILLTESEEEVKLYGKFIRQSVKSAVAQLVACLTLGHKVDGSSYVVGDL